MTCKSCSARGICLIVYEDDTKVYAVCLCAAGERWRKANAWHIWAFQNGVDQSRVKMLEDAVTPEELAARGFTELAPAAAMDAIAAAARRSARR